MAMLTTPTTIPVTFAGSDIDSASTIIPDGSRGAPLTFVKHRESAVVVAVAVVVVDVSVGVVVSVVAAATIRSRPNPCDRSPPEKRPVSDVNCDVTPDCSTV